MPISVGLRGKFDKYGCNTYNGMKYPDIVFPFVMTHLVLNLNPILGTGILFVFHKYLVKAISRSKLKSGIHGIYVWKYPELFWASQHHHCNIFLSCHWILIQLFQFRKLKKKRKDSKDFHEIWGIMNYGCVCKTEK